ncbi:transmembrane protease serine 11A-like [Heteronotia binoei]|uniref:transmembrane protease serine 11A-like n=1 Tax=Heteronotia binoei TaxID=13085 RepID=UPI00292D2B5C|nr:transmembrane protease serine 11A-like [Heteronotia binoei]
MARSVAKRQILEPWKIALIVLAVLVILAIVIGLLVYFLAYDQKKFFYNASFRINNVRYQPSLEKQTSDEFRELSMTIETLINQAFQGHRFKKRMTHSYVVRLSPDEGAVLADVVLVIQFLALDSQKVRWESVNNALLRRLRAPTGALSIDLASYRLSEIPAERGGNLIYSCCGTRVDKSVERIYGGNIAEEGEWPWHASLQLNGVHRCGASLIDHSWLVTAAHCFRGFTDVNSWTTSFGALLKPPKMKRSIRQIIVHEHYANNVLSHEYDIAVAQISPPVQFTSDVHRVCLPEAGQVFPDNTTCFVTGWGALRDDGPSVHELRETKVKIIGNEICNRREVYNNMITPGMLCAGYLEGGSDACQGDSGGPLVTPDSRDRWYLVGIVSWGNECGKPNKPGVYTRVTHYRDWIAAHTGV